jgi:hypothetical protein
MHGSPCLPIQSRRNAAFLNVQSIFAPDVFTTFALRWIFPMDQLAELGCSARARLRALRLELRSQLRCLDHLCNGILNVREYRLRRFRRCQHAEPRNRFVRWHRGFGSRRHIGQLRRTLVTADTQRTESFCLDVREHGRDRIEHHVHVSGKHIVTACGAPLYGTCVISMPAMLLKSSIASWFAAPLPAEA